MKFNIPKIVWLVLAIAVVLAVLHGLGARRSTAALAGIVATPTDAALAVVYLGSWFTTVIISPVVLIAWCLLRVDRRLRR